MNIITRKEAVSYLSNPNNEISIGVGDINDQLIRMVSSKIADFCNRTDWGGSEERTEYHNGGSQYIIPNYPNITAISAIYDDVDHEWTSEELIDSGDYWNDGTTIYFEYRLVEGFKNVKIIYTAGYDGESNVPQGLKDACLKQLEYEYLHRQPARFNYEGDVNGNLTDEVKLMLKSYNKERPFA